MKSCHVCEIFVVNKQMLACLRCKDVYCKRCVDKYFKDFSFEEAMIDAKSAVRLVSKCFLCRHVCKCRRCEQIKRQDHYVEHMVE